MEEKEFRDISLFRAKRAFATLSRHVLIMLEELKAEHHERIEQTGEALVDMEEFIEKNYNILVDLGHLSKQAYFLTDDKYQRLRKSILDTSNNLQRELEK